MNVVQSPGQNQPLPQETSSDCSSSLICPFSGPVKTLLRPHFRTGLLSLSWIADPRRIRLSSWRVVTMHTSLTSPRILRRSAPKNTNTTEAAYAPSQQITRDNPVVPTSPTWVRVRGKWPTLTRLSIHRESNRNEEAERHRCRAARQSELRAARQGPVLHLEVSGRHVREQPFCKASTQASHFHSPLYASLPAFHLRAIQRFWSCLSLSPFTKFSCSDSYSKIFTENLNYSVLI